MPDLTRQSRPSADTVAVWLVREAAVSSYRELGEAAIDVCTTRCPTYSAEEVADLVDVIRGDLPSALGRLADAALEDGRTPEFELSDDGAYFRKPGSSTDEFVSRMQQISPDAFEHFCARVLAAMGAKSSVIGGKGDDCVDFVGRDLPLGAGDGTGPTVPAGRALVVGQAKRYGSGNYVKLSELREFVGGSKRRVADPADLLTNRAGVLAPIVYAFWTSSEFERSARAYAREMGIWYLNGHALAQLAMRFGIAPE